MKMKFFLLFLGAAIMWTGMIFMIMMSTNRLTMIRYPWLNDELEMIIEYNAKKNNLSEDLIYSLIDAESDGEQFAKSKSGARGYMQIMPFHYPRNPEKLYDKYLNVEKGCHYLKKCMRASKGNIREALRMYNQGIYGKRWRYKNWAYVDKIMDRL